MGQDPRFLFFDFSMFDLFVPVLGRVRRPKVYANLEWPGRCHLSHEVGGPDSVTDCGLP